MSQNSIRLGFLTHLEGAGDRVVAVARLAESAEVLPEEGGG